MPEQPVYAVSELVGEMRQLMERSYPEIWIEGELSSLSRPASGHWYFSLKDEQAQLRCAMFRNRAALTRYQPKVGDLVRVRAKISVYTARGDLQCIVQHIEDAGLGLLQRRFDELKEKLSKEGLFDVDHKRALPTHPKRIGLITSVSGAAIRDVLTTLKRRSPGTPVTVYPAVVQGDGASATLLAALSNAEEHAACDVLILTRGGGSIEDLWCFNDESLARAIHACRIPIVSAIGHEVDVTIADFVADLRAPTPTAAAELVSPDLSRVQQELSQLKSRLIRATERAFQSRSQRIDLTYNRLRHPRDSIARQHRELRGLASRLIQRGQAEMRSTRRQTQLTSRRFLRHHPRRLVAQCALSLESLGRDLIRSNRRELGRKQSEFAHLGEQLNLVSPLATLERGFAIAQRKDGQIVRSASNIKLGESLSIRLAEGSFECDVTELTETEDN